MIHTPWCTRQAQPHAACYRLVGTVTVAPDLTVIVELSKARDVPAVISLTTVRGPHRSTLPLHVEAAHSLGEHLDQAVGLLVTRTAEGDLSVHSNTPG
jgi:hypothetical protein